MLGAIDDPGGGDSWTQIDLDTGFGDQARITWKRQRQRTLTALTDR